MKSCTDTSVCDIVLRVRKCRANENSCTLQNEIVSLMTISAITVEISIVILFTLIAGVHTYHRANSLASVHTYHRAN